MHPVARSAVRGASCERAFVRAWVVFGEARRQRTPSPPFTALSPLFALDPGRWEVELAERATISDRVAPTALSAARTTPLYAVSSQLFAKTSKVVDAMISPKVETAPTAYSLDKFERDPPQFVLTFFHAKRI